MESLYEDVVGRRFAGGEATERVKAKMYSVHTHLVIVQNTAFTNRQLHINVSILTYRNKLFRDMFKGYAKS